MTRSGWIAGVAAVFAVAALTGSYWLTGIAAALALAALTRRVWIKRIAALTRRVWITGFVAVIALAALFLYIGYIWGRTTEVPQSTDFWKTFGPPIATFAAGLCTLAVGGLAFFGVVSTNTETRKQSDRNEELKRCWERFIWLAGQTSGAADTATAVFPPEVVSDIVASLVTDARRLKDDTLVAALTKYQLLVVAQQFAETLEVAPPPQADQNSETDD
jgi:hypothetical protein